ncbi:MAG: hypothetical protein VW625_07920 [Perlucidibaca sp.]
MRRLARGLAAMLLASLAGCMTPQALDLRQQPPAPVELADVPFFLQQDFHCGPATLAMVMTYLGQPVTPDALAPDLYPERLPGELRALADAVHTGAPVIVLQNNGLSWLPLWHYAVLIGVDATRGEMVLRSGDQRRLTESWSVFDRTWARGDRWAIRLLPVAGTWPDTVSEKEVTRQLLAMVRPAPGAALTGLRQAVTRWPRSLPRWLALADASEHEQGARAGEAALREGLLALPGQPWLLNNLADLLRRSGRAGEALPLAQQALAADDREEIRDTLRAIEADLSAR